MGRYNFRASRVYETVSRHIEAAGRQNFSPAWYKTVEALPPSEILTRVQPTQHRAVKMPKRTKKLSKMYMPQQITYEEDALRTQFFSHHPWELARPREIVENDGKDYQHLDWSKIEQKYKPLDGESVVQRQLWLMHNENKTAAQAYDIARHEFYKIRHQEEVERRIAREEALSTGAYFGKSRIEAGLLVEDKMYETWRNWAVHEAELAEQQQASNIASLSDGPESPEGETA